MPATATPSLLRTTLLFVCCAIAAWGLTHLEGSTPPVGVMAGVLFLMATPLLNRSSALLWQIVARAIWWQGTLIGFLFWFGADSQAAPLLALGCVGAVVVAGRVGLGNESPSFAPVAYRRTLMTSLVFAVADLIALGVYATVWFEYTSRWPGELQTLVPQAALFIVSACVMAVAIFGLFRLRVWGLVTCLIANLVIAALALSGAFGLREFLAFGLTATAIAQLLIPLPLLRGMWRARD